MTITTTRWWQFRAFEKYGIHLTVEQLGAQWLENNAGSWGSSEQALLLLKRGVKPPDTGNPRYNKLWWTIGPQFSSDVYGTLAPGMPNVAGEMARRLTHINGYAEGTDGAVFVSGMISLGFVESDTKEIVRKAAHLSRRDLPIANVWTWSSPWLRRDGHPRKYFELSTNAGVLNIPPPTTPW